MEFLHTARELQIITLRKCVNFPKRYTFYIGQPIADLAIRIYLNVKMANSIYPTNAHEVQLRKDYLIKANAECYTLASQIEVAHELFGLEPKVMENWCECLDKEIRLIKGVIEKDKERYKNIS